MIIAELCLFSDIDFERIGQIAKKVGAIYFVDMAHIAGFSSNFHLTQYLVNP